MTLGDATSSLGGTKSCWVPLNSDSAQVPRPPLLALSCGVWSAATLCTALAPSFWPLAGSRAFFALGNAAMNPVAFGMIPELFPR